jgi:hypothetical protein
VASVLRSAAVKKVVPFLSTRVETVFLCLAAILNFRNARVPFVMAERHPLRNCQFIKAEMFFISRRKLKIRNNQPV